MFATLRVASASRFDRFFVLVLSRQTVIVIDSRRQFDYEHEHHFIEHEHDWKRKPRDLTLYATRIATSRLRRRFQFIEA
jgi:hypothetical protein